MKIFALTVFLLIAVASSRVANHDLLIPSSSFNSGSYVSYPSSTTTIVKKTTYTNPYGSQLRWNQYPTNYVNPTASQLTRYWSRIPGGTSGWRQTSMAGVSCNAAGQPIGMGSPMNYAGPTRFSCILHGAQTYAQVCLNYQQCVWLYCSFQPCFRMGGRVRQEMAY
jgi:hypothetical protein